MVEYARKMELKATFAPRQTMAQKQALSPQMRESLRLLAMDGAALERRVAEEIATNPVLEPPAADMPSTGDFERLSGEEYSRQAASDWPDDDYAPENEWTADEDAAERRRRFFDRQTAEESLEEHLAAQLPVSGIPEEDMGLARALAGDLDSRGWFAGSMRDYEMVYGVGEARIRAVLREIMQLDPPGCGATSLEECLLAQIEPAPADKTRALARRILESGTLEEAALGGDAGREKAASALGADAASVAAAMAFIATLEPRPGRAFAVHGKTAQFVKPEVRAVRDGGRWLAVVDDPPFLSDLRVSPKYLRMLQDPSIDAEAKKYLREKMSSAQFMADALSRRSETLRSVAQAVFDAQPAFFERGLDALAPMTMQQIADRTGLNHSTVSRTVAGKYAATPHGAVELHRFFTSGWTGAGGAEISQNAAIAAIKRIVEAEDSAKPLSDEAIAAAMAAGGMPVARRTVAKYRAKLGIPGTSARRKKT